MFERMLAAFESMAVSLVAIAASLKDAAVKQKADTAKPAPATVAAPAAVAAPAPAAAPVVAAPADDDLGLGPDPAAPAVEKLTKDKILSLARDASEKKGRPFVKSALEKVKATTVKDLKEEQYEEFVKHLSATA